MVVFDSDAGLALPTAPCLTSALVAESVFATCTSVAVTLVAFCWGALADLVCWVSVVAFDDRAADSGETSACLLASDFGADSATSTLTDSL